VNPANFPKGEEEYQETPAQELFVGEQVAPVAPVPAPQASQPEAQSQPSADLDDLLNQYSAPVAPVPPAPAQPQGPAPSFDSVQPTVQSQNAPAVMPPENPYQPTANSQMPGAGAIPSTESVFGPNPENATGQLNIPQNAANGKKKLFIIIGAAVIGLILVGGLIFLATSLLSPKDKKTSDQQLQEGTFKISEEISKVMDLPLSSAATFEQSIDFADVIVPTVEGGDNAAAAALEKIFAKPIALKGTYKTDTESNIQLDGTFNAVALKKTYISADKSTYVFNETASTWTKVATDTITEVPAFYSPQVKAALFYNTKVNTIEEVGEEILEGSTYRKMKIIPKADIVENVISAASPNLAKTNYDSLNTDDLEIFAWVTNDGQIYKIAISGNVGVVSDLYEGTVKISSSVTFQYNEVQINKP
jgi:hypothetical protein